MHSATWRAVFARVILFTLAVVKRVGAIIMKRTVAAFCLTLLSACSTVETTGPGLSNSAVQGNDRIELLVRTGNPHMDEVVYEMAYQQFGKVMPLREAPPYTSALELTFASSKQSGFIGSSSTLSSANATASGWYTRGGGTAYASGTGAATTFSSGTFLEWQNSTMLAVLRRGDGERLWTADYSCKGGWELSGWVVNTPEEAARLVSKRLAARYVADTHKH